MSVCDPVTGMHQLFSGVLPKYYFADKPECTFQGDWNQNDIVSFQTLMERHHQELSAVILEPIVQGAGGMRFYHPEYLRQVRSLCDQYDVLLIADEIATGFGRTGKLFACNHADIVPDIMCLGKALTGGTMTLAATIASRKVEEVISSAEPGIFMHGPTFMANPLACAVASASIRLLLEFDYESTIQNIEKQLQEGLSPCRELESVADVRVLGAIGVVELKAPVDMARIQPAFVEKGVWVRPFGKLVYVMPPYCMNNADLQILTSAICSVLEAESVL
jgi:adenosylmethionine-8-amino-7-oxononanoate aminotransferase